MGKQIDNVILLYDYSDENLKICKKVFPDCVCAGICANLQMQITVPIYKSIEQAITQTFVNALFIVIKNYKKFDLDTFHNEIVKYNDYIKKIYIASICSPNINIIRSWLKKMKGFKIEFIDLMQYGFNDLYSIQMSTEMPWYCENMDEDIFTAINEVNVPRGSKILDLGTGSGHQAFYLAEMGFKVTATDISKEAFVINEDELSFSFVVDDILNTQLTDEYEYICDRGCFHNIHPESRENYVKTVHRLLNPSGMLILKSLWCRNVIPRKSQPYSLRKDMLNDYFMPYFSIVYQRETFFQGKYLERNEMPALISVFKKR